MSETVGERLKRLRLERGLAQRQLAAPGVSYAYISRIEAGMRQPSVKALRKLAARLDVTPEYLEFGEDPPDIVRIRRAALLARQYCDSPFVARQLDRILDEVS